MKMFLIRASGTKNKAHYWDGKDTACKRWLSGGMNHGRKWNIRKEAGSHPICTACLNAKINENNQAPGLSRQSKAEGIS